MTVHAQDLMARLQAAGGRLSIEDGQVFDEASAPLPDELVEQLRAAKPALIDMLGRNDVEPGARPGANVILLAVPPGGPGQWAQGVADLLAMALPVRWPGDRWTLLREDAFGFLRDHGAEAARLGWDLLDIFAVDPRAPVARYDAMGLVPLLHGRRVVELHHHRAVIENHGNKNTTFTRHPVPATRVAVWELDRRSG